MISSILYQSIEELSYMVLPMAKLIKNSHKFDQIRLDLWAGRFHRFFDILDLHWRRHHGHAEPWSHGEVEALPEERGLPEWEVMSRFPKGQGIPHTFCQGLRPEILQLLCVVALPIGRNIHSKHVGHVAKAEQGHHETKVFASEAGSHTFVIAHLATYEQIYVERKANCETNGPASLFQCKPAEALRDGPGEWETLGCHNQKAHAARNAEHWEVGSTEGLDENDLEYPTEFLYSGKRPVDQNAAQHVVPEHISLRIVRWKNGTIGNH